MTPKLYILLPVHNRINVTRDFIADLEMQSFKDYHLVLIDDGSTDGTADMVQHAIDDVTVITGDGNLWWAGSLQKGIDWLKDSDITLDDIVLIINDDVRINPHYLESAVNYMRSNRGVLLLSKYSCDDGKTVLESGVVANFTNFTFKEAVSNDEINCLSTRGLFIRYKDVRKIGDFHPRILPHYYSDYEYTLRAYKKGMRCITSDEVYLCPNYDTTGHHQIKESDFHAYLRKYFSIKSPANPIYSTVFVLLASPRFYILPNLARVWYRSTKALMAACLASALNSPKVHR